jgi:ribosomal protein S7
MRAKHRELTEKYKAFRLQPDSLYLSRLIQTFFNKFTKKGKKALARRHLLTALTQLRFTLRHPQMYYALLRIFHRLRIQFLLASKRKGRNLISVPVPVRRNKRDVLNIQTLYKAVTSRRERALSERIHLELTSLTFKHRQASTVRARSAHLSSVYTERVYMEER